MLEGLPYIAIMLLLLLLVLFLILLFIFLFLLCASRLLTRQSKVDGTLVLDSSCVPVSVLWLRNARGAFARSLVL